MAFCSFFRSHGKLIFLGKKSWESPIILLWSSILLDLILPQTRGLKVCGIPCPQCLVLNVNPPALQLEGKRFYFMVNLDFVSYSIDCTPRS